MSKTWDLAYHRLIGLGLLISRDTIRSLNIRSFELENLETRLFIYPNSREELESPLETWNSACLLDRWIADLANVPMRRQCTDTFHTLFLPAGLFAWHTRSQCRIFTAATYIASIRTLS